MCALAAIAGPRPGTSRTHRRARTSAAALIVAAVIAATAVGCGTPAPPVAAPEMSTPSSAAGSPDMSDMPGMAMGAGPDTTGLTATSPSGYRFTQIGPAPAASQPGEFRFQILGPGDRAVTSFDTEQTKQLHFYVIRDDLSGFQHVHPTLGPDGTWTAALAALSPGTYRVYAQFSAHPPGARPTALVLGSRLTVPGRASPPTALPAPAVTTEVDGYTLTLGGIQLMAGVEHELTVTISRNGRPVTDLHPYLDAYAHLTAFHQSDLAFAHLHPTGTVDGDHGGPRLSFHAMLPAPGNYRLYLQFHTAATLHTAALTLDVQ
jgi:hypothetical protein